MKTHNKIRVHLDTGRSIEGVLVKKTRQFLYLADAQIDIDGVWQNTGTMAYVPRNRIEWAQRGTQ